MDEESNAGDGFYKWLAEVDQLGIAALPMATERFERARGLRAQGFEVESVAAAAFSGTFSFTALSHGYSSLDLDTPQGVETALLLAGFLVQQQGVLLGLLIDLMALLADEVDSHEIASRYAVDLAEELLGAARRVVEH